MKKFRIISIFAMAFLSSCGEGADSLKCKESVKNNFPNAIEIVKPTNQDYVFIVLDSDSTVWYIETRNIGVDISEKENLFSIKLK